MLSRFLARAFKFGRKDGEPANALVNVPNTAKEFLQRHPDGLSETPKKNNWEQRGPFLSKDGKKIDILIEKDGADTRVRLNNEVFKVPDHWFWDPRHFGPHWGASDFRFFRK